ncbi:MAG: dCTP deaminase, partial [Planctomycetaceae bacterium]
MYLSDRDLAWAIETDKLIVDPPPERFDPTSIDLHLDAVSTAKIWDIEKYLKHERSTGKRRPELRIAHYNLAEFSKNYLGSPPDYAEDAEQLVGQRGQQIVVKRGGFLLWQTREVVGTPSKNADLICFVICFVDGKSTRARAGIVIHLTAPTIHAAWKGKITLEIANLGPFDLVLEEGDVIAQLTVCRITSPPRIG